jgi:hypothetical protein
MYYHFMSYLLELEVLIRRLVWPGTTINVRNTDRRDRSDTSDRGSLHRGTGKQDLGLLRMIICSLSQTYKPDGEDHVEAKQVLLWDRKAEGGFPGTRGP